MTSKCGKYKRKIYKGKEEVRTKERMERKKKEVAIEGKIKRKNHTLIVLSSTLKLLVYYSLFQSRPSVKVFLFSC